MTTIAFAAPPALKLPDAGIASATNHPNLVLDLSVEFPTVGHAYIHQAYNPSKTYVGYFDAGRCYRYPVPSTYQQGRYDASNEDAHYFIEAGAADNLHRCHHKFSGNFLNWSTSSAIDILRLSMTGGDRVIDRADKTVLQRAVLPLMYWAAYDNYPPVVFSGASGVSPGDVTPYSVPTLYVTSCRNRVQFAQTAPYTPIDVAKFDSGELCDSQTYPDKKLGEFLVRVEVCSDGSGAGRPDLCHAYGSHFKPEGAIQKNAEKMRFAAFSYLNDNNAFRNGGVLRAPMQYVGPFRFDATLQRSANPNTEWDATTGVFTVDPSPDGAGTGISGVINYLNKFGRNGIYKSDDPVAELFYESIRYLQGLQPTTNAVANITPEMKDGFPVITQWTDPIIGSCQKNSVLLIADAYTHHEFSIPGNTRSAFEHGPGSTIIDFPQPIDGTSNPALDIMAFTHRVGVMETTTHGVDMTTRPQLANLENQLTGDQQGHGFEGGYYLPGVAYWANTSELRRDAKHGINAQTYVIDVDEYGSGVTTDDNTRKWTHPRDSQLYLAAKYGAFRPDPNMSPMSDPTNPFWPVPSASTQKSAAGCYGYLWDPNGSCDPPNYFLATDGSRFAQAVKNAFLQLDAPGEAVAQAGVSSTVVTEGTQQYIYQGKFLTPGWAGDVRRMPVTYSSASGLTIGAATTETPTTAIKEPNWPVPGPGPAIVPRKIFTYKSVATPPANSTIPFDWSALSASQRTILNSGDALGEARLHYLRGSTSDEQSIVAPAAPFRQRPKTVSGATNVLGDIVHSNPFYVGAPAAFVQGAGYQDFYATYATRAPAVYVGANDGMLHAFDASLTKEYFAYVPGMIFSALPALSKPDYQHRAYVDGGISVAEAKVGNHWKTVLASAMGSGAQGVFALDVTDPQNFSGTSGALWEFSDADDADMGNVFSAPVIAKFNRAPTGSVPNYEYFVVVSSGVNNYAADGHVGSATGGALFLLSLNKGAGTAWQRNVNYFKFQIPDNEVDQSKQAGLSAPAMATGNDGAVLKAYAGDLQGQLWRFTFPPDGTLTATVGKLFTATDAGGNRQPITTAPAIAFSPDGGYVVMFGTGKYMESSDVHAVAQDSMYGIRDTLAEGFSVPGRTALAKRTLAGDAGAAQLTLSGNAFAYSPSGANQGWYFDFLNAVSTGERVITNPQLAFGRVIFNTLMPLPAFSACPVGSSGRSYSVNVLTGLADGEGVTGTLSNLGILGAPIIFTTREAGQKPATANAIGRKTFGQTYSIASVGSAGTVAAAPPAVKVKAGRLSWREIFNPK